MKDQKFSLCPNCEHLKILRKEKDTQELNDSYGEITPGEFIQKSEDLRHTYAWTAYTLKEDFTGGISPTGELYIAYVGRCTECGWGTEYNYLESIKLEV